MNFSIVRITLSLALVAGLAHFGAERANAQCGVQPQMAYSPVAAQPMAAQPVVYQTVAPQQSGWYLGKYIGRLFGWNETPTTYLPQATVAPAPSLVTAAYRPTYPVNYAQQMTVGYAPVPQSVARPVTLAPVMTMSPINQCCASPCDACSGVTTAGYDSPSCPNCSGGSASDLEPSYGDNSNYNGGNYNGGSYNGQTYNDQNYGNQNYTTPLPNNNNNNNGGGSLQPTPAPGFSPSDSVPEQRLNNRPLSDAPAFNNGGGNNGGNQFNNNQFNGQQNNQKPAGNGSGAGTGADPTGYFGPNTNTGDSNAYFQAPKLWDPRDRTTRRPAAPVWNAVYQQNKQPSGIDRTAYRPQTTTAAYAAQAPRSQSFSSQQQRPQQPTKPRTKQVGASGWQSTSN